MMAADESRGYSPRLREQVPRADAFRCSSADGPDRAVGFSRLQELHKGPQWLGEGIVAGEGCQQPSIR
jgi:hypothetical protein